MIKQNVLTALLVSSILLNGFFLGGYWYAHHRASGLKDGRQRIQAIVRQLDLDPSQKELFLRLKTKAVRLRRSYKKRMANLEARLWKCLLKEPKDMEEAEGIIHEMSSVREQYQKEIIRIIGMFIDSLNKEQRKKFSRITGDKRKLRALIAG